MTRVTADAVLRERLGNCTQPVEVYDESGRLLGWFLPTPDPALYDGLESPISPEELRRRRENKGKTYTTAEVLAHLEKL